MGGGGMQELMIIFQNQPVFYTFYVFFSLPYMHEHNLDV